MFHTTCFEMPEQTSGLFLCKKRLNVGCSSRQAAEEQNPEKFIEIIREINNLLEEKERRLGTNSCRATQKNLVKLQPAVQNAIQEILYIQQMAASLYSKMRGLSLGFWSTHQKICSVSL